MNLIDLKKELSFDKLDAPSKCIREGGLVVFPTETVYGIGANAFDENAVDRIFKAKGRPNDNPLIVHISDYDMMNNLVSNVNNIEKRLMENFWPGALTIILPRKKGLAKNVTCGLDTVGIRMPSNEIALKLIEKAGVPIAAPSANVSGRPSGTQIEDIFLELKDKVDFMIDGHISEIGVESTVIKVVDNEAVILRPGKISPDDIAKLGINVKLDEHIFKETKLDEIVESPGMKHRHYAPTTKTILIDRKKCSRFNLDSDEISVINELIAKNIGKKIVIVSYDEYEREFENFNVKFLSLGNRKELSEVSQNVFKVLREIDKLDVDLAIIQGVEKEGLGIAIMNRLFRACQHNVIEV